MGKSLLTEWINNYTCIFRKWDISKLRISNLLCRIAIFLCAKSYLSAEMQGTAARITHEVDDTYMLQI